MKTIGINGMQMFSKNLRLRPNFSRPLPYELKLWAIRPELWRLWLPRCLPQRPKHGYYRNNKCRLDWRATSAFLWTDEKNITTPDIGIQWNFVKDLTNFVMTSPVTIQDRPLAIISLLMRTPTTPMSTTLIHYPMQMATLNQHTLTTFPGQAQKGAAGGEEVWSKQQDDEISESWIKILVLVLWR